MKADVKSVAQCEKEALEWAAEFFREHAVDLGPTSREERLVHYLKMHFDLYDGLSLSDFTADDIEAARKGYGEAIKRVCVFAAVLLERDDRRPSEAGMSFWGAKQEADANATRGNA